MASRKEAIHKAVARYNQKANGGDKDKNKDKVAWQEKYIQDVAHIVAHYSYTELNPFRSGKKLLVLDIDGTIYCYKVPGAKHFNRSRPFLHDFLEEAYKDYDIVIWSATKMKRIEKIMEEMGILKNPDFKIALCLDAYAMVEVPTKLYGVCKVKALDVIWGKYAEYSRQNTIIIDDQRYHFEMNPRCGLEIDKFEFNGGFMDTDLLRVGRYLKKIQTVKDFSTMDHRNWENII